jgi:hypothetical protein
MTMTHPLHHQHKCVEDLTPMAFFLIAEFRIIDYVVRAVGATRNSNRIERHDTHQQAREQKCFRTVFVTPGTLSVRFGSATA